MARLPRLPSGPVLLSTLLVLASVTDKLANFATTVVGDLGLPGIFLLMVAESAAIPIPSEPTMLFAGFNVHQGTYGLWEVVGVAVAANLVGSWIAYAVGYYGRLELVERHGNKLHIKQSHLDWADRWFAKYGDPAIFFSRMLPIIRTFISVPAGAARVPFWRFTILTVLGCIPWMLGLTLAGRAAADNWDHWRDPLHYVDYLVLVLIVAGIIVLLVRRRRGGADDPGDAPAV